MTLARTDTGLVSAADDVEPRALSLRPEQTAFFQSFGYLHLPKLFATEIELLREGFEEMVSQSDLAVVQCEQFYDPAGTDCREVPRMMLPWILDLSPKLSWFRDDPRLKAIALSLLGPDYEYGQSDGSLMNCDVQWHNDGYWMFGGPMHFKLMMYLDHLTADSGALRVLPGSHLPGEFRDGLCRDLMPDSTSLSEVYGVSGDRIPATALEVEPGDLIVLDFRTFHASFNGGVRRRLITTSFVPSGSRFVKALQVFGANSTRVATPGERAIIDT